MYIKCCKKFTMMNDEWTYKSTLLTLKYSGSVHAEMFRMPGIVRTDSLKGKRQINFRENLPIELTKALFVYLSGIARDRSERTQCTWNVKFALHTTSIIWCLIFIIIIPRNSRENKTNNAKDNIQFSHIDNAQFFYQNPIKLLFK